MRDLGALAAALARPQNTWAYGGTDGFALAAACGFGLARNHPFTDGNKRIASIATLLFLDVNGWSVPADTDAVEAAFLALAAGEASEDDLAAWLRTRALPL